MWAGKSSCCTLKNPISTILFVNPVFFCGIEEFSFIDNVESIHALKCDDNLIIWIHGGEWLAMKALCDTNFHNIFCGFVNVGGDLSQS